MAFESEAIRKSQEIFYFLLGKRELEEKDDIELYRAYVEDESVRELVKRQAQIAQCSIEKYGNVIYLIPDEDNKVLGYSKKQLKSILCKSNATDKEYYLSQFVILTLITEFYDGQGNSSRSKSFLKLGEFINIISERLAYGASTMNDADEEKSGLAFSNMREVFDSLKNQDNINRQKTNKIGFVVNILEFMQDQGLITFIELDEMITPTEKLTAFMDWNLLNKNNYERIRKILGEEAKV